MRAEGEKEFVNKEKEKVKEWERFSVASFHTEHSILSKSLLW